MSLHRYVEYGGDRPAGIPVTGRTTSGAVSVSRSGAVKVRTGSGAIDLDDVNGAVEVQAGSGAITGKGSQGRPRRRQDLQRGRRPHPVRGAGRQGRGRERGRHSDHARRALPGDRRERQRRQGHRRPRRPVRHAPARPEHGQRRHHRQAVLRAAAHARARAPGHERRRRNTSSALFVSPGTRLPAELVKTAVRPELSAATPVDSPSAGAPSAATSSRSTAPVRRSRA